MTSIKSNLGQPVPTGLIPIGKTSDLSLSGKGVVCRPDYLPKTDFSDSGQVTAETDGKTFEVVDATGFEKNLSIRIGTNKALDSYVITNVDGTDITVDRDIKVANGATIYLSDYYSVQKIGDTHYTGWYDMDIFIYILAVSEQEGRLDLTFRKGTQITDFHINNVEKLSMLPVEKVNLNNSNAINELYYCQPF